jgi:hypothetical protein
MTSRFVDPWPGLKAEYEVALAKLRVELGEPRTLRERRRFRRQARNLWVRLVLARSTANW